MAWTAETKAGFAWATLVVVLFLIAIVGMGGGFGSAIRTPALLVIPFVVYLGFLAWVNRAK